MFHGILTTTSMCWTSHAGPELSADLRRVLVCALRIISRAPTEAYTRRTAPFVLRRIRVRFEASSALIATVTLRPVAN
jgi:hypothetical protein